MSAGALRTKRRYSTIDIAVRRTARMAARTLPKLSLLEDLPEVLPMGAGASSIKKAEKRCREVGENEEAKRPKAAVPGDDALPVSGSSRLLRIYVGVAETIGKKRTMEDKSTCCRLGDGSVYAGVFDGHSGARAAEHAAAHLHAHLDGTTGPASRRFEAAYANCEREILASGARDGTTACTALVEGEEVVVANLGDTRCVLGGGGGRRRVSERLSTDHKPDLPSERSRIERAGGSVVRHGAYRVSHEACPLLLATSRTLGDRVIKRHAGLVSPEPEIKHRRLRAGHDDFLILATDGLWDVVSDQEAVALVYDVIGEALANATVTQALCTEAAATCIRAARKRCTMDNVLVLVLCFQWRPQLGAP